MALRLVVAFNAQVYLRGAVLEVSAVAAHGQRPIDGVGEYPLAGYLTEAPADP